MDSVSNEEFFIFGCQTVKIDTTKIPAGTDLKFIEELCAHKESNAFNKNKSSGSSDPLEDVYVICKYDGVARPLIMYNTSHRGAACKLWNNGCRVCNEKKYNEYWKYYFDNKK